ncbi:MAG: glycosyltransferase, partial [Desulfovermiculus sp.]
MSVALESLLQQTFSNFEILAVNNGSTDATGDILRSFAWTEPRLRVLHLEQAGIVAALNHGLHLSRGQYIARMDADDISLPHRFQTQLNTLLAHPQLGLVGGQVVLSRDSESNPGRAAYVQWLNNLISPEDCALHRFVECPLAHPTFMFRSSIPSRLGAYRSGPFPEDYELVLRWAEHGVTLAKAAQPVLIWRDSPSRLSRRDARYFASAMYELKSPFLARWLQKYNPHHPEVIVLGAGRVSRKRVAWLEQEGIRVTAYADISPGKIGQKIHGKRVISVYELPPPGHCFCLSYVGQRGKRNQVKIYL